MDSKSLTAAFYVGAATLVGIAWGLDRVNLPNVNRFAKYGYAQAIPQIVPRIKDTGDRSWEDDPIIEPGRNPALRHLPVYQFRHTDGWFYGVQAESPEAATAIFESIRTVGDGQYLHRARDRIIQHPFDLFEGSPHNLPPLPPGWVPVPPEGMWPAANEARPRRQ